MLLTIIVFFAILSVLVLVHEFGHFIVGKWSGIGVLEFALGLPFTKPIWTKKLANGMRLSFYPLLFGGFVKLAGEEGESEKPSDVQGNMFYAAPVWNRIAVVVAGVIMNLILAVVAFYLFLGLSGFRVLLPKLAEYNFVSPHRNKVVVTTVALDSPAKSANINPGDVILSVDGKDMGDLAGFQKYIKDHAGKGVLLSISDVTFSHNKTVTLVPRVNPPVGQGAIGVGIGEAIMVEYKTFGEKITSGGAYSWDMLVYNLKVLGHLAVSAYQTKNAAPITDNVSGPVGIAGAVGQILNLGGGKAAVALINFVGLLSLSLAFMNVLPIPALDGGRLAFLLVEAVTSKKIAARHENIINQAGMFGLLALIVLITFNDVWRLVSESGILSKIK